MTSPGDPIRAIDFMGRAKVRLTTAQTITDSAFAQTQVEFDHAEYDDLGFWDQPNFQFKIPPGMAGVYEVVACASFATNGTGIRRVRIRTNLQDIGIASYEATSNDDWRMTASAMIGLLPGFTVIADVAQSSGGNLDLNGDELSSSEDVTSLSIARIHPLEESQLT